MYQPSDAVLQQYADLLVQFALAGGKGIRPKDVVQLTVPDTAKPILQPLLRAVLEAGGYPKVQFMPTKTDRMFFDLASDDQLTFFPEAFRRAEADLIDHQVSILADADPRELNDIDPKRVFRAMDARRRMRDWLDEKEAKGHYTWTLGLYATPAMAKEAGMTLEEYWQQIIVACYLDRPDPIAEWRSIYREQERLKSALNALGMEWLEVKGKNIDLTVQVGGKRRWMGGSGRNIPSYELFISPDWRGTDGTISFNQPLYRYGNILEGITLEFRKGKVVKAVARKGQRVLDAMLQREHADRIGEYSLTDRRFSRITKFMANTLYDENIGGRYGNTHLALGKAYKDGYDGDVTALTASDWEALGFNESPEHTDIISTEDRTVTARLKDGCTKIIFEDGMFTV